MSKPSFVKLLLSPRFYLTLMLVGFISAANIGYAMRSPSQVQADSYSHEIVINEVAWAGTKANPNHQWIELYNPGSVDIDITGWKIKITDLSDFLLGSMSIPAGGYYLIESVEDATSVPSDQLLTKYLNKSGSVITLVDDFNVTIDIANASGGAWAGGDDESYCSMERFPSVSGAYSVEFWLSNDNDTKNDTDEGGNEICGTPRSANSAQQGMNTLTPTSLFTSTPTPTPTITPAPVRSIVINEVAWMGNYLLIEDEWIELYNPGSFDIPLEGWTLFSSSNSSFYVELTGTIKAKSYFVVARMDHVFGNKYPDQVVLWTKLNNNGDSLFLYDPGHNLIDTANKDANSWPAGNPVTFCSMERGGATLSDSPGNWLTFSGKKSSYLDRNGEQICGSPWEKNWGYSVTPTPSPAPTRTPTPTPTGYRPVSVVLNEFLIRPREDHNKDGVVDSGDAYIEIINLSHERKYLDGWRIDDQAYDSPPYFIDEQWIDGDGGKLVFYAKDTNILLSAGTDSVRLFNDDYGLNDAFTYTIDPEAGKSWCRFSDGYGTWTSGCIPSPGKENNYKETTAQSDQTEQTCDFYSMLDKDIAESCQKTYEWNFTFGESLFGDPIELNIGGYRLLIK